MPEAQGAGKRHFHDELDALQDRLMEMAGRAEDLVKRAVDALLERDGSATPDIREADQVIDELEIRIDEDAMELLALQQPMAKDLRQIVATLKIANDLERVGDHAVNIARATARIAEQPPIPDLPEVEEMARIVRSMLADSLAAFVARDPDQARAVCVRDDRVDDLRRSLYRILVTHMLEDTRRITTALELLLVAQNLERVADLATNISEDVVFLVEGKTIKHHAEEQAQGE